MNLAIKLSNLSNKEVFTNDLKLILCQLHQQFVEDPDCLEQQMNTSYFWVVGLNSLGREIYLIFPPNYSNAKVEQEKNKIMHTYFANLFVWLMTKEIYENTLNLSFQFTISIHSF